MTQKQTLSSYCCYLSIGKPRFCFCSLPATLATRLNIWDHQYYSQRTKISQDRMQLRVHETIPEALINKGKLRHFEFQQHFWLG